MKAELQAYFDFITAAQTEGLDAIDSARIRRQASFVDSFKAKGRGLLVAVSCALKLQSSAYEIIFQEGLRPSGCALNLCTSKIRVVLSPKQGDFRIKGEPQGNNIIGIAPTVIAQGESYSGSFIWFDRDALLANHAPFIVKARLMQGYAEETPAPVRRRRL